MAAQICNINDNGGGLGQKSKGYYQFFYRRKTACRSKPVRGIAVKKAPIPTRIDSSPEIEKKRKSSESSSAREDDGDLKKRRVCTTTAASSDCGSVDDYEGLGTLGAGSYGTVYKVREKESGEIMAMKEEFDGLSPATLTEIDILKSLRRHPNIVGFKKVAADEYGGVYVVMEYMDTDLRRYIKEECLAMEEVKMLMKQLLEGVKFLHQSGVMHRDLKPANILVNKGGGDLKICDFGRSIRFGEAVGSLSPYVGTLWYRAPELLIGVTEYSTEVDMWAVGCIMAELVLKKVLFAGDSAEDQLHEIYCTLGHPNNAEICSSISSAKSMLTDAGFDLLKGLLSYNTKKRITAEAALNHVWFQE